MNVNVKVPQKPEHSDFTIEEKETTSLLSGNGSVSNTENGGPQISPTSKIREFLVSLIHEMDVMLN